MKLTQEEKLYLKLMAKSQLQEKHPEAKPKPKKKSLLADMFSQAKEYGSGASKNLSETPVSKEAVKTFDKGAKISKIVAKDLGAKGKKLTKEARERIKNLDMFLDDFEKAQKKSKKHREATKQTSQDFKDSANMEDEYEEWLKKNQKPDNTQKINVDVFKESDLDDLEKAQMKTKAKREAMKEESDYRDWLLKNQDIPKLKAPKKQSTKKFARDLIKSRTYGSVNMKYKRK